MEPADWFTISRNVLGASKFYLQSPFRFSYFRAVSVIFFVDIVVCALILLKFWRRFGFFSFGWLGCGMFLLVALWFLALRTHERLNLLLTTGQVEKLEIGSPLDIALGVAATVTNVGFFFACGAVAGCLMAFGYMMAGQ
jgi:hypothetical protein